MKLIGVTGGVGMGKSTSSSLLRGWNHPVVDTDDIAREVVAPGEPALAEIAQSFGSSMIDAQGQLHRKALAEVVFANEERRRELESILHPRIRQRWLAQTQIWRGEGRRLAFVVIPLLFETAAEREFDRILCVACSPGSQQARLMARGWTKNQIDQRISAQWPVQKKIELSHFLIWTEPSKEVHAAQLRKVEETLADS
jgi:dephospho-CoA kinase